MTKRIKIQYILEFTSGISALYLSNFLCFLFFTEIIPKIPEYSHENWTNYGIILFTSYTVVFFGFASSLNLSVRSKSKEAFSAIRNCTITYVLLAVTLLLTKNEIIESRYLFVSSFIAFSVISLLFRYVIKKYLLKKISGGRYATQTGIITVYPRAEKFIDTLGQDWSKNIKAIALIDAEYSNGRYTVNGVQNNDYRITVDEICNIPVVANSENLMGWIRTASLDEIYINLPHGYTEYVSEIIEELQTMGITVNVNIPSLENIVENSKFDNIDCVIKAGHPIAVFSPSLHNDRLLFLKRVIDVIGGLAGCIISAPIILITAIPLLIESPGPLIFKQQRIGKNGRIFNIYKLRSMYADAEERKKALMEQNQMEGFMFKMDNDPRITKVGKFIRKTSIDELPQFWNVLKGDMSLVGTRPPTLDEFEKYESHHKRRLSLKPGITGLWQVSGRSSITDFEDVVKLDCSYIDNWSLMLDVKILFKTVGAVITHKGAE